MVDPWMAPDPWLEFFFFQADRNLAETAARTGYLVPRDQDIAGFLPLRLSLLDAFSRVEIESPLQEPVDFPRVAAFHIHLRASFVGSWIYYDRLRHISGRWSDVENQPRFRCWETLPMAGQSAWWSMDYIELVRVWPSIPEAVPEAAAEEGGAGPP